MYHWKHEKNECYLINPSTSQKNGERRGANLRTFLKNPETRTNSLLSLKTKRQKKICKGLLSLRHNL